MSKEGLPTLALISSPQNAKTPDLPNVDLRDDHYFSGIMSQFDRPFGEVVGASLQIERQMSSAVMSVGGHNAFIGRLNEQLPQKNDGRLVHYDPFQLFLAGHSIGEMASFIEAGMVDAATMAWVLNEREKITNAPISSGIRLMLAAVNLDMSRFTIPIEDIRKEFDGRVQAVLANKNTAMEGVLSVHVVGDEDLRSIIKRLNNLIADFKHPLAERPVRLIQLPISNAFHSRFLRLEENILIKTVSPELTPEVFTDPDPTVFLYSAMANKRIRTRKQGLDVLFHQLTAGVDFTKAMEEMMGTENLLAVITADVSETTPKLVAKNIGDQIPILNIKDQSSLRQSVDQVAGLILPYSR